MVDSERLSILAVPGRGQDDRVWGGLVSDLRRRYEVARVAGAAGLANRTGDVILASADAASAAVHAARDSRGRAIVLLAPLALDLLPGVNSDPTKWGDDLVEYKRLAEQLRVTTDPEERRSALVDGLMRTMGQELSAIDTGRLREMLHDFADVVLDPAAPGSWSGPYADQLRAMETPVLILAAEQNERAAATARALAQLAPHGELVLLKTAQASFPWLAQPDAALAAVTRFLETVA